LFLFAAVFIISVVADTDFVEVRLGTTQKFETLRSLVKDRDDFESLTDEHAIIRVHSPQTVLDMRSAGLEVLDNYPDLTKINALQAHLESALYTDRPGAEPNWTAYCNYACLTNRLADFVNTCPTILSYRSIGKTVRNRDIWVVHVIRAGAPVLPEVFLAGNIHGDETVGGQLLQRYLWDICNKYGTDAVLTSIVNSIDLYVMPMFNPDGYESNTRANANGVDLNRDFPNTWTSPSDTTTGRQPETAAYMNFTKSRQFKLSLMYHGGAVVANYPYDSRQPGTSGYSATDRDLLVQDLSVTYSYYNTEMYNNRNFPPQGIVNGAMWYVIYGSAQDFAYDYRNTIDITLEVSTNKWPAGAQLPNFYNLNYNSLNNFVLAVNKIG
jgi:carboxypeptidase D